MITKLNRFFFRLGSPAVYFIATAFLASVWASIGFQVWQKLDWLCAMSIWILFLVPAVLGYYLGGVIDKLNFDLKMLVDKSLGFQPSVIEIDTVEKEKLSGLLKNNKKYKRLWWLFIIFTVLIFLDIIIGIGLYKSGMIK